MLIRPSPGRSGTRAEPARPAASRRASSSSWRMMLAASRSIRARCASRCVRDGGPPDRPRGIRPSRRSASNDDRRSSRRITGRPSRRGNLRGPGAGAGRHHSLGATGLDRQAHDQLADVLLQADTADRVGIGLRGCRPSHGGERPGDLDAGVGDGQADPSCSEVDTQDPAHRHETIVGADCSISRMVLAGRESRRRPGPTATAPDRRRAGPVRRPAPCRPRPGRSASRAHRPWGWP